MCVVQCLLSTLNPTLYDLMALRMGVSSPVVLLHNLIQRRFVQSGPLCVAPCIETFIQMGGQWILTSDQTRHNC